MSGERAIRAAVERLDVLEEGVPREACQVKGCDRSARYEWAGNWGTRWLCYHHIPAYRTHDHILRRIRSLNNATVPTSPATPVAKDGRW